MTRLVAILSRYSWSPFRPKPTLYSGRNPVPGWTVIQVYGEIKQGDRATFNVLHGKRRSGSNPGDRHRPGRQPLGAVLTWVDAFT